MLRGGAVHAALLAVAAATTTPAAAQTFRSGHVCWSETPCPGQAGEEKAAPAPRPAAVARGHRVGHAAADKRRAAPLVLSLAPSAPAASAPRLYRYPSMYSAEAPPLLPPGAHAFAPFAQQPYVLVSQGIWYWPGASDFKMPQVPGFEPVIDPGRVISW